MTTTDRSTVVGVFPDEIQADQAINALRQAGFSDDQISYSGHGTASGGFFSDLKSFFTGEDTNTGRAYDDLVAKGIPEQDARYYQQEYQAGRSIVAVTGGYDMQLASSILAQYGGYGANRGAAQTTDYSATAGSTQTTDYDASATGQAVADTDEARRLRLREEQLQVSKQPVQTGEVGIRKEVITEQKTIDVPVTREEVVIEQRPVSGQVSDTPIGEGEEIRVPVREEQVNVSKQTVDKGEVAIGKRQVQETKQVSDTVRREEARVEREGDVNLQGTPEDTP